jgi:S-DNA-T family DNA segregation ATPase FtsK/SpoIIIE
MLYLPPGTAMPQRVHGAFVSDDEVHRVVEHLKASGPAEYIEGVLDEVQTMGDGTVVGATGLPETASAGDESDPLYDEAVKIVTESRRASISGVQRHLKIGYNRAARLIEAMERPAWSARPSTTATAACCAPPPRG